MSPSLDKPWYPVDTHRGFVISQRGRTFRVVDQRFKSMRLAREAIDAGEIRA